MSSEGKKIQLNDKDVVAYKNVVKNLIESYIERCDQEDEELDPNMLANLISQMTFKNFGIVQKATTAWLDWRRRTGQL